jgi:hypothetical protein
MKKKCLKILLFALAVPVLIVLLVAGRILINLETGALPLPVDYDDPESLIDLADRTGRYIFRANPDRNSPARQAELKEFHDIAMLDVSDEEKARLIRERFPEESFWTEDMKELLRAAESGESEAQYQLGCLFLPDTPYWDDGVDCARGKCMMKSGYQAFKWFHRAATQGHVKAQNRLAYLLNAGYWPIGKNNLTLNRKSRELLKREKAEWSRKAIENGDPFALIRLREDDELRETTEEPGRTREEGLALFREAAGQGHVKAMLVLAEKLFRSDEGEEWYRRAAEAGSVEAMAEYADLCEKKARIKAEEENEAEKDEEDADEGITEEEDGTDETGEEEEEIDNEYMTEAKLWSRKAFDAAMKQLDAGDAEGLRDFMANRFCRNHLEDYLDGEDKASFAARIRDRLWELLEQSGEPFYASRLDLLYIGFAQIAGEEKETILRRLLDLDDIVYSSLLGQQFFYHGNPQNEAEAVRMLRIPAGFGYPGARMILGRCHLRGDGVPQDKEEGVKWLRMAAERGDDDAIYSLREIQWSRGPLNWPEALEWTVRTRLDDSPTEYCLKKLKEMCRGFRNYWRTTWVDYYRNLFSD